MDTLQLVEDYMNEDKFVEKNNILPIIKQIFDLPEYMKQVKVDIHAIFADKKLTLSDVPIIISVILKLNNLLSESLKLRSKLKIDKMKYIIFAVLQKYMIEYDIATLDIKQFFNSIWFLIELNPLDIKLSSFKNCSCCSEKSSVKEPIEV